MKESTIDERAKATDEIVRCEARNNFREGNYTNPYGDPQYQLDCLTKGMSMAWEDEMSRLINERICPTCGQPTLGDLN